MTNKRYFFSPLKSSLALGIMVLMASILMSYSGQPPVSKTGAPGETSCMICHDAPNPDYGGIISIEGLPDEIIGDQTYSLTLKAISTAERPVRGGFELVVLDTSFYNAGSFALTDLANTNFQAANGRDYVGHKDAQPFGNSDTITWHFDWTAPPYPTVVNFYAASVLANGLSGNKGDNVITYVDTHTVAEPLVMEVVIDNVSEPFCYGGSNGTAHATVLNGMQPYSYEWSTGDTLSWVYTLTAGTYGVTVTDANGEIATQDVTIGQPDEIIANITASSLIIPCGDSVVLHATASGGTGPLYFSWNTGVQAVDSIIVKQSGYYCVSVLDSNQCAVNTCVGVNADQNGVFCNGITADTLTCNHPSRTLFSGVTANDTITYSWSGPNNFTSNDTFPQVTQGGVYTLTATIPNGCSCTSSFEVIEEKELSVEITELQPTTCAYSSDGSISAELTAGNFPPLTTNPPNFEGDSLSAGDYSVTVANAFGCTTTVDFTIESPDSIQVTVDTIINTNAVNFPGAIHITTIGGTPGYNWTWTSESDTTTISGSDDGSLTNIMAPGDYLLTVVDENGCTYHFGPYTVDIIENVEDLVFSNSLNVSPNPAEDFVVITQKDPTKIVHLDVKIYNTNNQLIDTYHFSERNNRIKINSYPSGMYQFVIQSGKRLATKRIIVK